MSKKPWGPNLRYRGPRSAGNKARAETAVAFGELERVVRTMLDDQAMLIMTAVSWRSVRMVLAHILADLDEAFARIPPPMSHLKNVDGEPLQVFGMLCTPEEQRIIQTILVALFGPEQAEPLVASAREMALQGERAVRVSPDGTVIERVEAGPERARAIRARPRPAARKAASPTPRSA